MGDYKFTNDQLIIEELYTGSQEIDEKDLVNQCIDGLITTEELHEALQALDSIHPGGRKPQPLKSNWMMRSRELPPERKTETTIFIDDCDSGQTICEANDMSAAYDLIDDLKKLGRRAEIRPETFDEKRLQEEAKKMYEIEGYQKGF